MVFVNRFGLPCHSKSKVCYPFFQCQQTFTNTRIGQNLYSPKYTKIQEETKKGVLQNQRDTRSPFTADKTHAKHGWASAVMLLPTQVDQNHPSYERKKKRGGGGKRSMRGWEDGQTELLTIDIQGRLLLPPLYGLGVVTWESVEEGHLWWNIINWNVLGKCNRFLERER